MIEIKLPQKLTDRHRLDWWHLSLSEHWCYITKMHAIYYVNTPYEELFPEERRGAPLIDDWMIFENNRPTGRWTGWGFPEKYPDKWKDCFNTEGGAREEALRRLHAMIDSKQEQITHIADLTEEIVGAMK